MKLVTVSLLFNDYKTPSKASKGLDDILIGYSEANSNLQMAYSLRKRNDKIYYDYFL